MTVEVAYQVVEDPLVVVIGAGVIGCSIAYHLARKGISVAVIDAKGVATSARFITQCPATQILVTELIRRVLVFTISNSRQIAADSIRRYPVLKDEQIIRHFAGVCPLPKDGQPYLGAVKSKPGLYVATSHSGITLAPVHGKVISELILDGKTDVPIAAYSPERYHIVPGLAQV